MHKAGGREAAAIRIVPVGRVELSTDIRSEKEIGKEERNQERESTSLKGLGRARKGIARGGP